MNQQAWLGNIFKMCRNTSVIVGPDKSRNQNSGGSGLGLYITKMILEHHGIL